MQIRSANHASRSNAYDHSMRTALGIVCLIIVCAGVLTGCGPAKKDTKSRPSKGYVERDVAEGKIFTLDEIIDEMRYMQMPDIIKVPREQASSTRGADDPVEYASSTLRDDYGVEQLSVGLFYNAGDADEAYQNAKKEIAKKDADGELTKAQRRGKVKRFCNAIASYYPSNNLTNLQLEVHYTEMAAALDLACKSPGAYKLGGPLPGKQAAG